MARTTEIKLPPTHDLDTYGFHQTAEGRQFLKELYPTYRAREEFGERKIVTLISDVSHLDQSVEYDNTRSALRRWSEGQGELWKDAEKTRRVLRRLEFHMMRISDVREILDDQAAEIRKVDIGSALAFLIYGSRLMSDKKGAVPQLLQRSVGLFEQVPIVEHLDGTGTTSPYQYCYYRRPEGASFLLVQQFWRRNGSPDANEMNDRWSGFAFPMPSGEIFRFLVNYADPAIRIFEMMHLVEMDYGLIRAVGEGATVYDVAQSIVSFRGEKLPIFTWGDPKRKVNHSRIILNIGSITPDYLEKLAWDIPI